MDNHRFQQAIQILMAGWGRKVDEATLAAYRLGLDGMTIEKVEGAVRVCLATPGEFTFPPSPPGLRLLAPYEQKRKPAIPDCQNCGDSGWVTVWKLYHRLGYCYIPRDGDDATREYVPGETLGKFCVLCGCRKMFKKEENGKREIEGPYWAARRFCKIELAPEPWAEEASAKWFELQRVQDFDDFNASGDEDF